MGTIPAARLYHTKYRELPPPPTRAGETGRTTTLAYGRAGACCACSRCGMGGLCLFIFLISSILSVFSNASSVRRRLDILKKNCDLGRSNPAVVVISGYQLIPEA